MILCWHHPPSLQPLGPLRSCQSLSRRSCTRQASSPAHRNGVSCIVQCHKKLHDDHHERPIVFRKGLSRRAVVASLIGTLHLGGPVLAIEPGSGPPQAGEARLEVPVPAEDDRAVPRGLRPGKPLVMQSNEAPASSPARAIQESQLNPEAAGRQIENRAPLESATKAPEKGPAKESPSPRQPRTVNSEDSEKEARRLLDEEEDRRKQRRRKKGRIRELEEIRAELAEKELVLLSKEQELLERDQTVNVLREELELEKKLRTLLTKEKEKAEEQSALALGLCTGGSIF